MENDNKSNQKRGLEGPPGEEVLRPLASESEGSCVFVHPLGKESEADISDSSLASSSAASGAQSRKRRQPYLCKPGKAKKPTVDEEDIQDPFEIEPAARTKKRDLPTVEDIQEELKACTSIEIKTRISESMISIEKVADSSRNLRGGQAQSLRLAARSTLAAASELAQRFSISDVEKLKTENNELRLELANLKSQLTSLTAKVSRWRQKDAEVETPSRLGSEVKTTKDPLVRHITSLMDQKLAELRAELLHDSMPSLKKGSNTAAKFMPREKKGMMKQRKSAHPPQLEVLEGPLASLGSLETEQPSAETWSKVAARKEKSATLRTTKRTPASYYSGQIKNNVKPPPAPKTAAVTITLTESASVDYATAMAAAKQQINLADCGISQVRQRKALTGGLVLEIPGPDSAKKADALAERLRAALVNMGVRIGRPIKTGELRVMDLDESITKYDVAVAIAEAGGCSKEEVKVGNIRFNTVKLGTAWVRCPLATVRKLSVEKHVRVGWVSARLQILAARQLQCFRCLEMGHVRQQCSNTEDRSLCCYNCGEQGHKAHECKAKMPKCPLCADMGRPADHRLGGAKCNPPNKKKIWSRPQARSKPGRATTNSQPANQPAEEETEAKRSTS